jgi:hypothetical protein
MSIEGRAYDVEHYDKIAVEILRGRISNLPGPDRARYATLLEQARQAGGSFSLSEQKTHRRFEIARGLVLLLEDNQSKFGTLVLVKQRTPLLPNYNKAVQVGRTVINFSVKPQNNQNQGQNNYSVSRLKSRIPGFAND